MQISNAHALSISIAIGIGALLVQLVLWGLSSATTALSTSSVPQNNPSKEGINLVVIVPAVMTVLIVFQLQVPIAGGVTNVSFADPVSFVGLLLFLAYWAERKSLPLWSQPTFNVSLAAMSLVILGGALHYWLAEGYSSWGIQNRLFGWFVLLGYLFCGTLLPTVMGEEGRRRAASSYLAAICIICLFELFRYWSALAGIAFPFEAFPRPGIGFSDNTNAQGLFVLAEIALTLALPLQHKTALAALGVLFVGVYLTGSRSALAAAVVIAIVCMLVDRTRVRTTLLAVLSAGLILFAPIALHSISNSISNGIPTVSPTTIRHRYRPTS